MLSARSVLLAGADIAQPLQDPFLTIYDQNGAAIAVNDNWQEDPGAADIMKNGFAPSDEAESATILQLPASPYTAIVSHGSGATGVGLLDLRTLAL